MGKKHCTELITDTGISKTLINLEVWNEVKNQCTLVKTSKGLRPYGTKVHLSILGKAKMWLEAENRARTETWVYILRDKKEQCLLG